MVLYNKIEQAIRQHKESIDVEDKITEEDLRHTIRWVMRDNPDIFWFDHQYHYDEVSSIIDVQYTFSPERVKIIQQSIKDVIDNDFCIEYVKTLNCQQQIVYVYKWLVSYCNYNANSAYNQSIYSVFVCRNSVCTGYAKASQYLFNLLGIDSRLVFGRLHNDKEDGRHCWNIVKLNNQHYHFDACFGDSILDSVAIKSGVKELFKLEDINYNFLCVSTDEIMKTRSIEDITTLPICSSWSTDLVKSLAIINIKKRAGIKGCLLSHIGSSADIYLFSKDKNTILKVFRSNSKTTIQEEYHYMQQTKGCLHLLQYNEQYTDIPQNIIAMEQSTPIVDLLCSYYYELSLKELIKMVVDVAEAWKECRDRGVLYRDIHVCNIYRSNEGSFKLGDFESCTNNFDARETVGNQWFVAPETFLSGAFTEASAVYSISMVMYFILNNLRPAFWEPGWKNEALQKRINGDELPIPKGCVNLPSLIKDKIRYFFKKSSSSFEERIKSITDFIYELKQISFCCKDCDYIIHRKGISLDLDLDAENINDVRCYILRNAYHKYAMGDDEGAINTRDKTFGFKLDKSKATFWNKIFSKKYYEIYSSIFAPAEVKRMSHMLVQVYLHLYEEAEKVRSLAKESDKNAERRDYTPLSLKLRKGDKVDVEFNVYGENRLMSERKSIIWQGSFSKCSFDYFVPKDIDIDELSCEANLFVNGAMIGDMRFLTRIVETPRNLNPEILSHRFNKIFISYAHQDAQQIKLLALAYKVQGIDYFYDRDSLAPGDIYEEKIFDYIDSSDLFVLCWSKNAAVSDYVAKEKGIALLRAYPQLSRRDAKLKICPISIEPRADLPSDMKEVYNFEVI